MWWLPIWQVIWFTALPMGDARLAHWLSPQFGVGPAAEQLAAKCGHVGIVP